MDQKQSAVKRLEEMESTLYLSAYELKIKLINVLLVASAACIGFAVTQTKDVPMSLFIAPWGVALFCWAVSFFFGCRAMLYKSESMRLGGRYAAAIRETYFDKSSFRHDASELSLKEKEYLTISKRARLARNLQFFSMLAGAVFFVAWHTIEMWRRTEEYTCLLWS